MKIATIGASAAARPETSWRDRPLLPMKVASQAKKIGCNALDASVEPRTVEYVIRLLSAVTGVLLRLHLQAVLRGNSAASAPLEALRELLMRAFSVAGSLSGRPRGWLILAWADPAAQPALDHAFVDQIRLARLSAICAAAGSRPCAI